MAGEVTYTALALIAVPTAIILDLFIVRTRVLLTFRFWFSYAIVFSFQLLTNGWLTGWGIVLYDEQAIWGTRLVNAPVEDLLFGFALILSSLMVWVALGKRSAQSS